MKVERTDDRQYDCLIFDVPSVADEVARRCKLGRKLKPGPALLKFQGLLIVLWNEHLVERIQRPVSRTWVEAPPSRSELVFVQAARGKGPVRSVAKLALDELICEAAKRLNCTMVSAPKLRRIAALGWTHRRAAKSGAICLLVSDHDAAEVLLSDAQDRLHVLRHGGNRRRLITAGSFARSRGYSSMHQPDVLALTGVGDEGISRTWADSVAIAWAKARHFGRARGKHATKINRHREILLRHRKPLLSSQEPSVSRPRGRATDYRMWLTRIGAYEAISAAQWPDLMKLARIGG